MTTIEFDFEGDRYRLTETSNWRSNHAWEVRLLSKQKPKTGEVIGTVYSDSHDEAIQYAKDMVTDLIAGKVTENMEE